MHTVGALAAPQPSLPNWALGISNCHLNPVWKSQSVLLLVPKREPCHVAAVTSRVSLLNRDPALEGLICIDKPAKPSSYFLCVFFSYCACFSLTLTPLFVLPLLCCSATLSSPPTISSHWRSFLDIALLQVVSQRSSGPACFTQLRE